MSLAQAVREYLKKYPSAWECLTLGLINTSALARTIAKEYHYKDSALPALVAALRRIPLLPSSVQKTPPLEISSQEGQSRLQFRGSTSAHLARVSQLCCSNNIPVSECSLEQSTLTLAIPQKHLPELLSLL